MKHTGPISGVAAHGNHYIATAGYDNQVILWDGVHRRALSRAYHDHLANQCVFSPCGRYLVSASSDYTARLWELPSLRLKAVYAGHDDDVEMASFHPSGNSIATCSRDHKIRLFDVGGTLHRVLEGHEADVISVAWECDGERLVSSSDDGTVRRWDAVSGTLIESIDLDDVETDTIVAAENGVLLAGDDNGVISVVRGSALTRVPAHDAGIKRLLYDAGKRLLVSLSYDRTMMIWNVSAEGELARHRKTSIPSIVWPRSAAFFGDNKLAFATFGSTYAVYDYSTGTWNLDDIEPDLSLNAVALVDDHVYSVGDAGIVRRNGEPRQALGSLCNFLLPFGRYLLTAGQTGTLFDGFTGERHYQHRSPLNCGAVFERDGHRHAIIGAYTGEGLVFREDANGHLALVASIQLHDNAIKGLASDGETIFSVCATGAAAFHAVQNFELVRRVPDAHWRIANGCVALGKGRFASVSRDLQLRLWHGDDVEVHATPHPNSVKCVTAAPDGQYVATGSYTGEVAVFDVPERRWVEVARPTAAGISCLAPGFAPGDFLASSYDGDIYNVTVKNRVGGHQC